MVEMAARDGKNYGSRYQRKADLYPAILESWRQVWIENVVKQ